MHPLQVQDVLVLVDQTMDEMKLDTEKSEMRESGKTIAREQCTRMLHDVDEITSIHAWNRRCKSGVNREHFKAEHVQIAEHVDGFCLMLCARVALALYPEKIYELARLLSSADQPLFRPDFFKQVEQLALGHWFAKNIRNQSGKVDWPLVHSRLCEIHPCEFAYQESREPFTIESALDLARKLVDTIVDKKGHWHPATDLEDADKQLYMFLTSQDSFRRQAKRPDINYKKDTRPNWFAIAKAMGSKYQATMVVGRTGEEQQLRSFEDAIDQLGDLIQETMPTHWTLHLVSMKSSALYGWFRDHCRKDTGVDIERILEALPNECRDSYSGIDYVETSFYRRRKNLDETAEL